MPHLLIAGMTCSGKTTFAKRMINEQFTKTGRPVLVLDPLLDPELKKLATWSTGDPEKFMRVAKSNTRAFLVIDEGGTTIGSYNKEMEILATQFRHLGHQCLFLVQRPCLIPVTIRANTVGAAVFNVSARDAKELALEYNEPAILKASGFKKGDFIFKKRFGPPVFGNIFLPR